MGTPPDSEIESGDLVYLSLSESGTDLATRHPFRDTFAVLVGAGNVPELERALHGASVGDSGRMEVAVDGDSVRAPPRPVSSMVPDWLADALDGTDVDTGHEFVASADDVAAEHMLDAEAVTEVRTEVKRRIADWRLLEYEIVDAYRWREAAAGNVPGDGLEPTAEPEPADDEPAFPDGMQSRWPMVGGRPGHDGVYEVRTSNVLADPEVQWQQALESDPTSAVVEDGSVYVASSRTLHALDATDGTVEWTYEMESQIESAPAVREGTVCVADTGGDVAALSASDGEWIGQVRTSTAIEAPLTVTRDGTVYAQNVSGTVYGIAVESGTIEWRNESFSGVSETPAVRDGIVYARQQQSAVTALDADTGDRIAEWEIDGRGTIRTADPVVARSNRVYTGESRNLTCAQAAFPGLDRFDPFWRADCGARFSGSIAVTDEAAFVPTADDRVVCLDTSGAYEWAASFGDSVRSKPAVGRHRVLVGCDDGHLYALARNDRAVEWSVAVGDSVRTSPAVAEGTVFVAATDGTVCAVA